MSDEIIKGGIESEVLRVIQEQEQDDQNAQNNQNDRTGSNNEPVRDDGEAIREWAAVYYAAAQMISIAYPSVGEIYTQDSCERLQKSLNPVFERYGLNDLGGGGGFFTVAIEHITAAAALIVVGKQTIDAINHDKQAKAQAEQCADIGQGGERCA